MTKKGWIFIFGCFALLYGCKKAEDETEVQKKAVARVNSNYLYLEDFEDRIPKNLPKKDSQVFVNNYITTWATNQLFVDRATENLTDERIADLDQLIEDYQNSLYTLAYKDAIVSKSLDTIINEEEIEAYYKTNMDNFNLNYALIKARYVQLDANYSERSATKKAFFRYNEKDKEFILNKKLGFITYSLNDSVWVEWNTVVNKVPILRSKPEKEILKKGKEITLKDEMGLYLIKIEKVRTSSNKAPLSYIKPRIRQLILNKRRLELIKDLETEITKDAIKNKQFEIIK